jgi:hypothetical protein
MKIGLQLTYLMVHRRRMVVEYPTTYAIIAYHHESCEFESCSMRGVLDTTLCNKVCQSFAIKMVHT